MKKALLTFMCLMASSSFADTEKATFGGGCFWQAPQQLLSGHTAIH